MLEAAVAPVPPFVLFKLLQFVLMLLSDGDVVLFVSDELLIFWFDDIPII